MSIQALADSLSISISTVSRALNGYSDVSAATRQRVFEAAKAMNYTPHPVAHRLATGKTGAIAIVNSTRKSQAIDGSAAALHTGMASVLRAHNYFVLSLTLPTDEAELPELERLLAARLVDAVLLTRTRTLDPRVTLLQDKKIPFVTYGRTQCNVPHAWIDTDSASAFEQATAQLLALGHQRIALINGMVHMTFASLYEKGFRKALADAGLDSQGCPVHYTEMTGQAGHHVASQLLSTATKTARPTAFVCATDALALGVMAAVRQAGLCVGKDVSVTGYGNSEAGKYVAPPLATFDHDLFDNGCRAAQLLLQVLAGQASSQAQVLTAAQFLPRESIGRL